MARHRQRRADGGGADAVGAWLERGILGTQLGPEGEDVSFWTFLKVGLVVMPLTLAAALAALLLLP